MKTPFECWLEYIAAQECTICGEKIGDLPYQAKPEGCAHRVCLDQAAYGWMQEAA